MKKILLILLFLGLLPIITLAGIEKNDQPQTPVIEVQIPFLELQPTAKVKTPYLKAPFPELETSWSTWITDYIIAIYKISMWAIVILVVIKIMIGGFLFIISQGNTSKVEEAKSHLVSAFGGLLIAIFAYTILYYVNSSLVNLQNIPIIQTDVSGGCPTFEDIQQGKTFKAVVTGYYKPVPKQSAYNCGDFLSEVALNCSCPKGKQMSYYGSSKPLCKYQCPDFDASKPYCNKTASGAAPTTDSIAADKTCFGFGTTIEITMQNGEKKIFTVTDRGSAIKGAHFDVFFGEGENALNAANKLGAGLRNCKVINYVAPKGKEAMQSIEYNGL